MQRFHNKIIIKYINKYQSIRYLSSKPPDGDNPPEIHSTRGVEAKGAMREFFKKISPFNPNNINNSNSTNNKSDTVQSGKSSIWSTLSVAAKKNIQSQTQSLAPTSGLLSNRPQKIDNPRFNKSKQAKSTRDSEEKSKSDLEDESLLDMNYFKDIVSRGYSIEESEMDDFDKFTLDILLESIKSPDGEVLGMEYTPEFYRVRLPEHRPLIELIDSTKPRIQSVKNDTEGYNVALDAWDAISKNYFYSDAQKDRICNKIALLTNEVLEDAKKYEIELENGGEDDTSVLDENFNKLPMRLRFDISSKRGITISDETEVLDSVDETNWDVEAADDEDDMYDDDDDDDDDEDEEEDIDDDDDDDDDDNK